MKFLAPQFLILLPFLAVAGWYFRRLELWRPLRAAALAVAVLLLSEPQIRRLKDGMDLWVLVDRSESADALVSQNFDEWKRLLERSRPTGADRLQFVDYAAEVVTRPNVETVTFPGNRGLTRTGLALQDVLALADRKKHTRLLIFSDGYSTEPLTGVPEKLREMGIPLDYRLLREQEVADFQVSDFRVPSRSRIGEPFLIDIVVSGSADAEVPVIVVRDGKKIAETKVAVSQGIGSLRFTDRIVEAGAHRYEARIAPETDVHEGNNRYESWIEITAGPRILLATKYLEDPVARILRAQGFEVQVVENPFDLRVGQLSGTRAVILNNVPAFETPGDFLEALNFFVKEQGGGLMMAGGKQSFGSGGYYESAIDPLLPVSMELKSEHRKLAVAMAIVMDRSGSMSMTVSSGHTKMALANEGAGRAVELLGGQDLVAVYAVDSTAHQMVELTNVGKHRAEIINRVRRIESMGGGIYVYTGLKAAWEALKKSEVGQRHIILFTDAADSEEPGDYKALLKDVVENGGTVSVIGLGTRGDSDAVFIEDVSKRGNGRIFFTDVPGNLPNIFAQETATVARSTFVEEPVGAQATGSWYEISNRDFEWPAEVDGYNLSYTREGDTAALVSKDEYTAPLVAFGRRGIGRTAAVAFPLGGEFSGRVRSWPRMGDFTQTLARWLMGEETPPGIGIRHELKGTELAVDLLYDSEVWAEKFARKPPRIFLSQGTGSAPPVELIWERMAPGHYSVRAELEEGEMVRGAVQAGESALAFGPVVVGSRAEWAFDGERVVELRAASESSGGRELLELSDAWRKPERKDYAGFQNWLLVVLLGLILADALVTRTEWRMPEFVRRKRRKSKKPRPAKSADAVVVEEPVVEAEGKKEEKPVESTAEEVTQERRSRFTRAKRRR